MYFLLILTLLYEVQKTRKKRRNHSPTFKAKVALAALKKDKTPAQISAECDVQVNQIKAWRKQLLGGQ